MHIFFLFTQNLFIFQIKISRIFHQVKIKIFFLIPCEGFEGGTLLTNLKLQFK